MPATIQVTGALPFSGNYQSFQSLIQRAPPEGPRTVPVGITWSTDGVAPNFAIEVNLRQSQNILQLTQIAALYVDNLSNDADTYFYFPDTQFRLTVPAATLGLFPVITNGLRFVGYSPSASDGDMTLVQVLNFNPPPVSVEKSQFVTPAVAGGISLTTGTVLRNLATGAGSIRAMVITIEGLSASGTDGENIFVTDDTGAGTGKVLFETAVGLTATEQPFVTVASLSGLDIPFAAGVTLKAVDVGGLLTGGFITANVYLSTK